MLHIFCIIFLWWCSLSDTPSTDKVSISYIFSFSKYQTKCVKFLFRQLIASWSLRFIFDHPLKQRLTGRKEGKDRNTKIWISQERKELFRWNKKHFSKILKSYLLVKKIKELMKIADTSFTFSSFPRIIIVLVVSRKNVSWQIELQVW